MLSQIDKQALRAVVAPRVAKILGRKPKTGPRIAVIGNCQSYGLAYAMKTLDPLADVHHYSAITKSLIDVEQLARVLADYDHVFMQNFPPGIVRGGDWAAVHERLGNATRVPSLTFAAFQPDLVYLLDPTRGHKALGGPLRPYHSALAVFAFRIGLSLEEASALFNRNVFETVGYLHTWNDAAQALLQDAQTYGLDLSQDLINWARRGVFMYSIVHPKPYVLASLARRLMHKAGLPIRHDNFEDYAIDDLARSEIFPVYPEIAELYGVTGGYLFKCGNFHVSHGVGEFLDLPQFLAACYKVYKRSRPEQLSHPRLETWLADAALSRRLVAFARENLAAGKTPGL
jgi:hypothetical protein